MKMIILGALLPVTVWANALLPLNNIWNSNAPKWFFISYFLILIIETLIFKTFSRQIKLLIHFKTVLIANLISSLVGSIIINLCFKDPFFDDSYSKVFTSFFFITVLTEYPVFWQSYSKFGLSNILFKSFIANFITYLLLFGLQLSGFLVSLEWVRVQANKYKSEWTHKEIVPENLKVIYEKRINSGSESELVLFSPGAVKIIKSEIINNVQALSQEFVLISKKGYDANGELFNWKTNQVVLDKINIYKTRVFYDQDLGLIIFHKKKGLEGFIGSGGWRKMYGDSYEVQSISGKIKTQLRNVREGGIYKYGENLIYSNHDKCVLDQSEANKGNQIERCSSDPSTHIVQMSPDGRLTLLAKNARNPVLRNTNLYYMNRENQIEFIDLRQKVKKIVLEESISDFEVTMDEKNLIIRTENMFPMGQRYFLVIIERSTNKRYIIDDGKINHFDVLEEL